MVDAVEQLLRVRRIRAECLGGSVGIPGRGGTAARFVEGAPPPQPVCVRGSFPLKIPLAYALFAVKAGAGAHEFVSHASIKVPGGRIDPRYLEFRRQYLRVTTHRGPQ